MPHRKLARANPRHVATPALRGRGLLTWVGPAPDRELVQRIEAAELQLQCVPDRRAALVSALPWVAVVHAELPDGDGVGLVEELHRRQPNLRSYVVATQTGFELCRRAFRAGARDVWPAPVAAELLTEALSSEHACAASPTLDGCDRLRELAAALLVRGVPASERARIVSAVAQALHTVETAEHSASFALHEDGDRLGIELVRSGGSEDLEQLRGALLGDPTEHGLARAQLLCEELRLERSAGALRVALEFRRVRRDAPEPEWLDKDAGDAALATVHKGYPPFPAESPLAAVLGAWLGPRAAREAERRAQRSLWS